MSDLERQRFNVPAHVLPTAEVCPEAAWLGRNGLPLEFWREGFRFGLIARLRSSEAHERTYQAYLRQLSDNFALQVQHAVDQSAEDVRLGVIPNIAEIAPVVSTAPYGPIEGTLIGDGYIDGQKYTRPIGGDFDMDIIGNVDHAWVTTPGEGDAGAIGMVLQHELGNLGKRFSDTLDMAACGLAWAAHRNVDRMMLGRCYHYVTRPAVYEWTPVIEAEEMKVYWERCQRALARPHVAAPGGQCERCPVRSLCAQWQYPILIDGTTPLKTLTERVDDKTYPKLKGMVAAMKHVLGVAEAKLRTYEREGRG